MSRDPLTDCPAIPATAITAPTCASLGSVDAEIGLILGPSEFPHHVLMLFKDVPLPMHVHIARIDSQTIA
jgi:hypothetical protein